MKREKTETMTCEGCCFNPDEDSIRCLCPDDLYCWDEDTTQYIFVEEES